MPIPASVWSQLLANTQASGQSFNPWALGGAAQQRTGGSLDDMINEARSRLNGSFASSQEGPSSAALLQAQQPGIPVSGEGDITGGPAGGPLSAIAGGRGNLGMTPGLLASLAGFALGVPFAGFPFSLVNTLDTLSNLAFGRGIATDAANAPLGSFVPADPAAVPESPDISPRPPADTYAGRVAGEQGVGSNPFSVTGIPGVPGVSIDAPGAGTGAGPGAGAGAGGGSSSGAGEAPYKGGYLKGPRTKERSVPKAHGGEYVLNNAATRVYAPLLEAMNASVQPDKKLDQLVDRARKFYESS